VYLTEVTVLVVQAAGPAMMEVDGSMLEGGGQILRVSIALSAVLQKTLHIHSIRAKRSKTGLRPQHLAGVELVSRMCGGTLSGGEVGSGEVWHNPGVCSSDTFAADPGTAGSVALLLQAAVPVACLSPTTTAVTLSLRGGTNAEMAPQMDYITRVFAPIAAQMGVHLEIDIEKRGYFPKGGGVVSARVTPVENTLTPITLVDRGELLRVCAALTLLCLGPFSVPSLTNLHCSTSVALSGSTDSRSHQLPPLPTPLLAWCRLPDGPLWLDLCRAGSQKRLRWQRNKRCGRCSATRFRSGLRW
jgi:RNA 3'-phosphate cyclase